MTTRLAIIGGTGALDLFEILEQSPVRTIWGEPSAAPARIQLGDEDAWFLARHGNPHRIPPHTVNYRANIAALAELGVRDIIAINAVGSVDPELDPGALVVPEQLIDYTWGREHSFSDSADQELQHIEFGKPFSQRIRQSIVDAAGRAAVSVTDGGCYGVTQGPRLETEAEIRRLAQDGCTLVGMTAMPEAALAREAGLEYASLCVVANAAAGISSDPISIEEIHRVLASAMGRVSALLSNLGVEP
jgi:5'-methylthioinosine phosphorylase